MTVEGAGFEDEEAFGVGDKAGKGDGAEEAGVGEEGGGGAGDGDVEDVVRVVGEEGARIGEDAGGGVEEAGGDVVGEGEGELEGLEGSGGGQGDGDGDGGVHRGPSAWWEAQGGGDGCGVIRERVRENNPRCGERNKGESGKSRKFCTLRRSFLFLSSHLWIPRSLFCFGCGCTTKPERKRKKRKKEKSKKPRSKFSQAGNKECAPQKRSCQATGPCAIGAKRGKVLDVSRETLFCETVFENGRETCSATRFRKVVESLRNLRTSIANITGWCGALDS